MKRRLKLKIKDILLTDLCEDARRFVEDIQKEPDRGVPLVAVAFLDDVLYKLLEAYFIDNSKIVSHMLGDPGALCNFAIRAELAYCLGLLPQQTYNDIKLIRKIRNQFGHSHHPVSFENDEIASLCKKLYFANLTLQSSPVKVSARDRFEITAIMIINTILLRALSTKHAEIPKDYKISQIIKV